MFEWMFSWAIPALALAKKHHPTSTRCFGKQCAKGKPISLEIETFTVLCYGWTKRKQMQMMITVTLLSSSFQEGCVVWRLISSSFCKKMLTCFSSLLLLLPLVSLFESFLMVLKNARPKLFRCSAGVDRWSCRIYTNLFHSQYPYWLQPIIGLLRPTRERTNH